MIPAPFEYHAPATLEEAVDLLRRYSGEARLLAGGQSLTSMMKLRLANPEHVIDLSRIDGLAYVRESDGALHIGPMTTYTTLMESPLVRERVPVLAEAAGLVADVQVRNRGTIGGSSAHADPAADLPAVLVALEGSIQATGGPRPRTIAAHLFFLDAFTTDLREDEAISQVVIPSLPPATGGSYQKFANKASHFAIVGVAVLVTLDGEGRCERVRIGVTGAGPKATRATAAESSLQGKEPTDAALEAAAALAAQGVEFLEDLHGSAEYREQLTGVMTLRALRKAVSRAHGWNGAQ